MITISHCLPIREHLVFLYKYVHFLTKILQYRRKRISAKLDVGTGNVGTPYVTYENK